MKTQNKGTPMESPIVLGVGFERPMPALLMGLAGCGPLDCVSDTGRAARKRT